MRSLYALVLLAISTPALADLVEPPRSTTPTYAVREGTRQLALFANHQDCKADAQARTLNAGAERITYQVKTGSGTVILPAPANYEECLRIPLDRLTADGARRPTPPNVKEANVNSCVVTTKYTVANPAPACVVTHNYHASYKPSASVPPPACTEQPSTKSNVCSNNSAAVWYQESSIGAPPQCAVTWAPLSPRPTDCPAPPAPTGPLLTLSVDNALDVTLAWSGAISRAYSIEKCRGAGCTNFAALACITETRHVDRLPATATARYRVRGSTQASCESGFTPYSLPQQVTVGGSTASGEAFLSWTPPATDSDGSPPSDLAGYYIVYGTSPGGLNLQVIVEGAGLTNYTVSRLTPGTWYFGMKSYTRGFDKVSGLSNIDQKTVR